MIKRFNLVKKIAVLIIFIAYSSNGRSENLNIVASISPIAAIIAMITGNSANISVLASNNHSGCVHNYQLCPSQLRQVKQADIIVYISDQFDKFVDYQELNPKAVIINISNNLFSNQNNQSHLVCNKNWHIWLSLPKVKRIMLLLHQTLENLKKDQEFLNNYLINLELINNLEQQWEQEINRLPHHIILNGSLSYIFKKSNKAHELLLSNIITIKDVMRIHEIVKKYDAQCIFITAEQSIPLDFSTKPTIIVLNTENWPLESKEYERQNSYFFHWNKIMQDINKCNVK